MRKRILGNLTAAAAIAFMAGLAMPSPAWAGKIFLTGHDPDFHAQGNAGAKNLLQIGLDFATNGTTNSITEKFLFVTARGGIFGVPTGHLDPVNGLIAIGLVEGTHFDVAHAGAASGATLDLSVVDFSLYTAIAVSSSFGGLLRRAELDGLIARKDDIKDFVNAGGGVFASSECDVSFASNCGADLINPAGGLFGYLPITATSVPAAGPFVVQGFGSGLGLVNSDMNSPTHNSFSDAGGLNIVDTDSTGDPTTLAGDVRIDDDGFIRFRKELTSGPDADEDGEIDVVVEVGQLLTSEYDFTLTYNNPEGPDVVIVDVVPAEWIVTQVGGVPVAVGCGETQTVSNGFGSADVSKDGAGAKCRSATRILWTPPDDGGELLVDVKTRQSPGKRNVKFAPTECGPLYLNKGVAQVFLADENGDPLRDPPFTGELLPPLFTAEPLVLAAMDDLNGSGLVFDGSGDEDGDGRSDIDEVRVFGSDPCQFSVDLIIDRDGIASEFVGPISEQEVVHGDVLRGWPTGVGFGPEGIDGFDTDGSGDWTPGDDIHLEDPSGSCSTALRDAFFDDNASFQDCRVRDDDLSLTDGDPVSCDFETGTFCVGFLTGPSGDLTFDDASGSGDYNNAEDIVLDVNKNGIFD